MRFVGPVGSVVSDGVGAHLVAALGESLSNIVRHADATWVTVTLDVTTEIDLLVRDDGRGFVAGRSGSGLRNIDQRAGLLGGSCAVESEPGSGTTVRWTVPRRSS